MGQFSEAVDGEPFAILKDAALKLRPLDDYPDLPACLDRRGQVQ